MSTPGIILRLSAAERHAAEAYGAGPVLTIGRSVDSDFCLPGARFSLQHARLVWRDDAYYLEAHPAKTAESDALTMDGAPVRRPVPLAMGDRFHSGGVDFQVVIQGLGVTADMGTDNKVGARVGGGDSMVQFGRGDGQATRNLGPAPAARDLKRWLREHWPSVAALALMVIGGVAWLVTRPPPAPPPPPPVEVDLCDIPYSPAGLDAACSSPDDCVKKAEAAVARAKRKAETGARGYEIMTDAMAAVRLAERSGREVDVSLAQGYVDTYVTQLTRLCRGVRLDVTQGARAGHRAKAYRACVSLLDAIPDPADPRYVWARKCMIDFAED